MKRWIISLVAGIVLLLAVAVAALILYWRTPIIPALPSLAQAHGSQLLFYKAVPYAHWWPFWTTRHQVLFIDPDLKNLVHYDPQKVSFGSPEAVHTLELSNNGISVNHNDLLNSQPLQARILCKQYESLLAKKTSLPYIRDCLVLKSGRLWVGLKPKRESFDHPISYIFDTKTQSLKRVQGERVYLANGDYHMLANGEILFLGQAVSQTYDSKTALLYLPEHNRIIRLPKLPKRLLNVAFLETKDRLFIFEEYDDTRSTLLYNPDTRQFESGPRFRYSHEPWPDGVTLTNGDALILGGQYGGGRWVERYDHQKNRFMTAGKMIDARSGPGLLLLDNHTLLISGGFTGPWMDAYATVDSIEVFRF